MKPPLPRYRVSYILNSRLYMFCIPAPNAAHVFRTWDRPAKLVNVVEVDRNNIEVNP